MNYKLHSSRLTCWITLTVYLSFCLIRNCEKPMRDFDAFDLRIRLPAMVVLCTELFSEMEELHTCTALLEWEGLLLLRDFDAFDLRICLPAVVSTLYKAVKQNGEVTYVHFTAGMRRASAIAELS
ncbi:unnamed protein product [Arabidopsis halleri]